MDTKVNDGKNALPTIVSGFGYVPVSTALWEPDPDTTLEFRELTLAAASENILSCGHFRTGGRAVRTDKFTDPKTAFSFVFVLRGKVTYTPAGQEPVVLASLDTVCRQGTGRPTEWTFSHDAEVITIFSTEEGRSHLGPKAGLPGEWQLNRDTENIYIQGEGPRAYFKYRDLGVAAATDRRIHIHVVRSTKALDGGTGWHCHTMGQIFIVLRGWADLDVEHRPSVRMHAYDAMCISPGMRHNVPAFTQDYLVLEMCVPADYDTTDVPAVPTPGRSGR